MNDVDVLDLLLVITISLIVSSLVAAIVIAVMK